MWSMVVEGISVGSLIELGQERFGQDLVHGNAGNHNSGNRSSGDGKTLDDGGLLVAGHDDLLNWEWGLIITHVFLARLFIPMNLSDMFIIPATLRFFT